MGMCVTNHTVEKCAASLQAKRPIEPDRFPVGPASAVATLIYEREKPQLRTVSTLLEYFSCLRLMMGAYAYCGTHKVESKLVPGAQVVFFPWETALGYADNSMHKVLEISIPEPHKLRWIRVRDEKTRATMAHLINEGYPGGEAIDTAMSKHAHHWDMEDKTVAADTSSTLASIQDAKAAGSHSQTPRGQKRAASGKGAGGKNAGGKGCGKLAGRDQHGKLICGPFNGKKGCKAPCPRGQRHCCNVMAPDGKACEGRYGHPHHGASKCPLRG